MVCTKIHVNNGWNQDWQKTTPAHQVFSKFCPSPMLGLKLHMVRIQRASNQKCLPSRELTCPPTVCHFLKIIFLFPRWDMLVFWRVGVYSKEFLNTSNHQSFIFQWWNGERKKHQSYTHHMKGDLWLYDSHKQNKWRFVGTNPSHFTPNSEKQIWASTWFTCHAQQECLVTFCIVTIVKRALRKPRPCLRNLCTHSGWDIVFLSFTKLNWIVWAFGRGAYYLCRDCNVVQLYIYNLPKCI